MFHPGLPGIADRLLPPDDLVSFLPVLPYADPVSAVCLHLQTEPHLADIISFSSFSAIVLPTLVSGYILPWNIPSIHRGKGSPETFVPPVPKTDLHLNF